METNTTHNVYEHPDGRRVIIKMGFCWPAFFFGPLWAWRRGMVVLGFLLLALLQLIPLLFAGLIGEAGIVVDLLITVGVLICIGGQGNAWLRRSALNRGFELVPTSPLTAL